MCLATSNVSQRLGFPQLRPENAEYNSPRSSIWNCSFMKKGSPRIIVWNGHSYYAAVAGTLLIIIAAVLRSLAASLIVALMD
jgi:hypothetical protein